MITAAFTDPNDSSAWFYQRWLLGYSDPKLDLAVVRISSKQATISFTKPVDLAKDGMAVTVGSVPGINEGTWRSLGGGRSDAIWIQQGDFQVEEAVTVTLNVGDKKFQLETEKLKDGTVVGIKSPTFGYEFGAAVMEELRNQLESCNQLLEYEPDSKWTLLTAALLMRSIDRFHYHDKTLEFLGKLEKFDSLRAGYYKDLASKWTVEARLKDWIDSGEFREAKVDLSNLHLTTLYYQQYFAIADVIGLQGNPKLNKNSCKFSLLDGCEVNF